MICIFKCNCETFALLGGTVGVGNGSFGCGSSGFVSSLKDMIC